MSNYADEWERERLPNEVSAALDAMEYLGYAEPDGLYYEWDEFHVFYDPASRMFYWRDDSGCSCNSYWQYVPSLSEFAFGPKEFALKALREWGGDDDEESYYGRKYNTASKDRLMDAIRNVKVPR